MLEQIGMTDQEQEALNRLLFQIEVSPQHAPLKDWLQAELCRLDNENRTEKDVVLMHQRQGACQTIARLLGNMSASGAVIDKINKK